MFDPLSTKTKVYLIPLGGSYLPQFKVGVKGRSRTADNQWFHIDLQKIPHEYH